ncbi:hypothetical protein Drorol1_Dr00025498, partial [Drosera rotundifolia]
MNRARLEMTRLWNFLGMPLVKTKRNQVVESDTGIEVDVPSFNDKGFGYLPSKWKGECETSMDLASCRTKLLTQESTFKTMVTNQVEMEELGKVDGGEELQVVVGSGVASTNRARLATTRSWNFLGMSLVKTKRNQVVESDTIVVLLNTGIEVD